MRNWKCRKQTGSIEQRTFTSEESTRPNDTTPASAKLRAVKRLMDKFLRLNTRLAKETGDLYIYVCVPQLQGWS
jgi:hypothetical protein